jgi:transcriptional regulator with XRE-family HTH domain
MTNLVSDFARAIRVQRNRRGISQLELGERLKMPQSQIARFEAGERDIRLSTLMEIARALDLEPMLVPKRLIPAVRYMIDAPEQRTAGGPRLVGNDPEDRDDE